MNWIDLISSLLGLCCVVLAGRRYVSNFWVGYVYNIFLFVLFLRSGLYASMGVQTVSFAINAYGHWRWTHPREGERESDGSLSVTRLAVKEYPRHLWAVFMAFCLIMMVLLRTDDPHPYMDAACTSLILLAQWLSARKKVECWWVWMVVNAANLVLYIITGLRFMPVVAALYLANGIWSLLSWKRNERNIEDK